MVCHVSPCTKNGKVRLLVQLIDLRNRDPTVIIMSTSLPEIKSPQSRSGSPRKYDNADGENIQQQKQQQQQHSPSRHLTSLENAPVLPSATSPEHKSKSTTSSPYTSPARSPVRSSLIVDTSPVGSPTTSSVRKKYEENHHYNLQQQQQQQLYPPSLPPVTPNHALTASSNDNADDDGNNDDSSASLGPPLPGAVAALREQNLRKFFDMAMAFNGRPDKNGMYVTAFPSQFNNVSVGMYGPKFRECVEAAPENLKTMTGFRPHPQAMINKHSFHTGGSDSEDDDDTACPWTKKRKKLKARMRAKKRWVKGDWRQNVKLQKNGRSVFSEAVKRKLDQEMKRKREQMHADMQRELEEKRKLFRLAQIGRANAIIAARRVLAQVRCCCFIVESVFDK